MSGPVGLYGELSIGGSTCRPREARWIACSTSRSSLLFDRHAVAPNDSIWRTSVVVGRLAETLFFGDAPGYPGYFQVNFSLPTGLTAGHGVPVRLNYLSRPSNEISIALQ